MAKVRIVIADTEEIYREGLAKLLKENLAFDVVATCDPTSDFIGNLHKWQPDVFLLHGVLRDNSGIDLMQCIREEQLQTNIIVLTHYKLADYFVSIIRAGAKAYLPKEISIDNLIKAITLVAEGNVVVSPLMAPKLLQEFNILEERRDIKKLTTLLSQREQEVLSLVAQGLTNKEIAATLIISDNTVKVHLRNVMEKLQVHTRQQIMTILGGKLTNEVTSAYTNQV